MKRKIADHILYVIFQGLLVWPNADPVAYQATFLQNASFNLCVDVIDNTHFNNLCGASSHEPIHCSFWQNHCSERISHQDNLYVDPGECFVMNVLNLATPTWEKINCSQIVASHLFCQFTERTKLHSTDLQIHPDSKSCKKGHILKNNTCYQFSWHIIGKTIEDYCPSKRLNHIHIDQFQYLFDAVTDIFPPIFSSNIKSIFSYKKFWNTYSYEVHEKYTEKEGIYVCKNKKSEIFKGDHTFKCNFEIYISYILVCDGKVDCPSDHAFCEVGCESNTITELYKAMQTD